MKKIFFSALALLGITAAAQAQNLILKAGANASTISYNKAGNVDKAKVVPGFHVGIASDIFIGYRFSFQPGVLLTQKGSKTTLAKINDNTFTEFTTHPLYVEVPANFVFHTGERGGSGFFIGAGPYVAMGIAGNNISRVSLNGNVTESKSAIKWNNDDPFVEGQQDAGPNKYRRFDFGLNALAGFETNRFMVGLNYGHGLAKVLSTGNNSDDDNNKFRNLGISVGFKF